MAAAITFAAIGCVDREAQKQAKATEKLVTAPERVVSTTPVGLRDLAETVTITGDVTTSMSSQLSAKLGGRLVTVSVREGDQVAAGQVIASVDATSFQAQLQQATATVQQALSGSQAAQAQLAQAVANARLQPSRSLAAVRQAEAALRSAQAQLQKAETGARPEEKAQAQAGVSAAEAGVRQADWELERVQKLVAEGALSQQRLIAAQTVATGARAQLQQAQEALRIANRAVRSEDLASAREAVRQAAEGVRAAKSTQQLDVVLQDQVTAARAQVESANAAVRAAQAQLQVAQENLADTQVRAPYAGRIAGKPLQIGTVVGPGTPIADLVGLDGVYFSGQAPSAEVRRLSVGNPVSVSVNALPGRTFNGTVAAISPQGDSVGRLFRVRISIQGDLTGIKPGMFASGVVEVRRIPQARVVPSNAIVRRANEAFVFVANGDKARRVTVTTGVEKDGLTEVRGVDLGAAVITQGQATLADGSPIKVQTAQAANPAEGSKG
jgi:HlyD family secretion protein